MSKRIIITSVVLMTLLSLFSLNRDISIITSQPANMVKGQLQPQQLPPINQSDFLTNKTLNSPLPEKTQSLTDNDLSPIDRIKAIQEQTQLHKSILKDHEKFHRYPEGNAAISDSQQDPVMQRYKVDERTTMSKDKSLGLTIWTDKNFYLKDDTVTLFAYIQDSEGNKLNTEFKAQLLNSQHDIISDLKFEASSLALYQSQINLSDIKSEAGIYKVLITSPKHNLTDGVTFTLTQPDIELTGEFKEHISNSGELVFEVEALVTSSSQYYIQASLYSSTQVAIGVSQFSTTLDAGLHWLPIRYSGLMIQDTGENGPFILKNVSLAKVTIPMMRAPLLQPEFTTTSYQLDEFK